MQLTALSLALTRAGMQKFDPLQLFLAGEQGVWYDPSDFIRYTQPGPELYTGGAITGVPIGGPAFSNYPLGITAVAGKTYSLSINVSGYAGTNTYSIGGTFGTDFAGTTVAKSGDGLWVFTLVALRDTALVIFTRSTNTANFNNISVRELTAIESCTMFQDAAGTTPVTSVEQPVGLMLDKRLGLVRGPELVTATYLTPAGFDNVTTPLSSTSFTQVGGTTQGRSYVTIPATVGAFYEVSCRVVNVSTGTVSVLFRDSAAGTTRYTSPAVGAGVVVRFVSNAFTVGSVVQWIAGTAGAACTVDSISIKEIPGNHAFQTTAIDRPVLRNRYNLLTKTEQFDDAAWTKTDSTVDADFTTDPLGGMTADRVTEGTANTATVNATCTVAVAVSHTLSVHLKQDSGEGGWMRVIAYSTANGANQTRVWVNPGAGVLGTFGTGGVGFTAIAAALTDLGAGWYRVTFSFTSDIAAIRIGVLSAAADLQSTRRPGARHSVWGASIVPTDQAALPYQRVNTSTDYDADPTKFPLYLAANGTNTWMKTGFIDFASAGTQLAIFAGVRKAVDTTTGMLIEHGPDASTTDGTFALAMPTAAAANSFVFLARVGGTSTSNSLANSLVAPQTAVLTCTTDGSVAVTKTRKNGATVRDVTSVPWAGVFSSRELFLFRRQGTALPFNGNFYGLVIRGALTTDSQIGSMERWLAPKTGGTIP